MNIYDMLLYQRLGGGGGKAETKAVIEGTITSAIFPYVSRINPYKFYYTLDLSIASFASCDWIGSYAFASCSQLRQAYFPSCTLVNDGAFQNCTRLSSAYFPLLNTARPQAFQNCAALSIADMPELTNIASSMFRSCAGMKEAYLSRAYHINEEAFRDCGLRFISFPDVVMIGSGAFSKCAYLSEAYFDFGQTIQSISINNNAFNGCSRLTSLTLSGNRVYELMSTDAFTSTPIAGYTTYTSGAYGTIYVQSSMYNSYITAPNWSAFSSRFASITS